jgi:2-methylisocitrate lyase-like PEP mutase family enzyme
MGTSLRELLRQPGVVLVPSVFNALGAIVAEQAGFAAVSVTGNGLSASLLGRPDMGLLTMTEVVDQTRYIAGAAEIPVIADADTGYGGPLNVYRAVKEFGAAGAAAVHIEDQTMPKRCAYLDAPPEVVPIREAVERIRAARAAADEAGVLLIARCDAHRAHGIDEVLRRAEAYVRAGADGFFSATIGSLEETRRLADVAAVPLMSNMNMSSPIARATGAELEQAGVKLAVYPSLLRGAMLKSMRDVLTQLKADGHAGNLEGLMATGDEYDRTLGTARWAEFERRFSAE